MELLGNMPLPLCVNENISDAVQHRHQANSYLKDNAKFM